MLTAFTIQNYESILDLRVDFSFDGRAPAGWQQAERLPFLQIGPKVKDRLAPVLALYGSNASGKSTIVEAFFIFIWLFQGFSAINTLFHPNKLNRKYAATTFTVEVSLEGKRYVYSIVYDDKRIHRESLTRGDGSILYKIEDGQVDFSGIESGTYDGPRLEEVVRVECMSEGAFVRLVLLRLARNFPGLNSEVSEVAKDIQTDISYLSTSNNSPLSGKFDEREGKVTFGQDVTLEEVAQILRQFDFGIKSLHFDPLGLSSESQDDKLNVFYEPALRSIHEDAEGNEVTFNFLREESEGTLRIVRLLVPLLRALKHGGLVIIDELDESIHPLVLVTLVRLFTSRRHNAKNARLLFTVHDTILLEEGTLRATEVGVVSKTLRSGTQLTRLCDFEGQPSVGEFRKQYLLGSFGGIPFPYI